MATKQQQQKQPEFFVAIVLPQYLWTQVHALKTQPDKKMVHIKLLQTGLPLQDIDQLAPKVAALVSRTLAFPLSFDTLAVEPSTSGDTTSVQLRLLPNPEHAATICRLNTELESILGIKQSARPFAPFLHLGSMPKAQSAALVSKMQKEFKSINMNISTLYFLARDAKDLTIRKSFPFSLAQSLSSSPPKPAATNGNSNNNNSNNNNNANHVHKTAPSSKVAKEEPAVKKDGEDKGSESGPCYRFSKGEWVPAEGSEGASTKVATPSLKIATLNVLFDLHDADKIFTEQRTPATFALLNALDADLIGLEEVTNDFLHKLLNEEWVKNKYFVSSLDVGYYGQVLLSRYPFRSCQVFLGKPVAKKLQHTMKKAVVAEFALNGKIAHVAVVHLTSDKSENAVEKRKLQLEQLDSWMTSRGTDNFLIGDFNFGDDGENALPVGYDDVWEALHPNDAGFTYDVANNTMAQVTTSKNKSSRFDRILCGASRWAPSSVSLFANKPVGVADGKNLFASDHYGVIAHFEVASRLSIPNYLFSPKLLADPLATYLAAHAMLPGESYAEARKPVLRFLESVMDDVFGEEDWKMELIGSSRLGVDVESSDLDIVVIGRMPRVQFFDYSLKVLAAQDCVADLRAVVDTVVPVVKLSIAGVHIDIQYCCIPHVESMPKRCSDINALTLLKLDKPSLVAVNGVIDAEMITAAVPDINTFRLLVLFIKLWAKKRNIYSVNIGYLGGYPLAIMAANLYNAYPTLSPSELVVQFFKHYAEWDLHTTAVSLPGVTLPALDPKKHAIPIFTPSKPVKAVVRNATQTTCVVVERELARAGSIVRAGASGAALWDQLTSANEEIAKLGAYLVFIVGTTNEREFSQWTGFVESRMIDIILQLERVLRSYKDPAPALRPCDRKYLSAQAPTQRAHLIIGVDVSQAMCGEVARLFAQQLDFSAFTRGAAEGMSISVDVTSDGARYFAEHAQSVAALGAQRDQNRKVVVGQFYSVRAQGIFEEAVEETEEDTISVISANAEDDSMPQNNNYSEANKKRREKKKKDDDDYSEKKLRMRTSVEVFNRIQWDASLPKDEFVIGYEDRFIGIMEVPFLEFDLESIPLHRIRIFKRKGVIVWSRNDRVDSLFKYN